MVTRATPPRARSTVDPTRTDPPPGRHAWAPTWASRAVALVGLVSIISALRPGLTRRLSLLTELMPAYGPEAAQAATVAAGVVLLMLAGGLRRRKRRAWALAIALAAATVVLHLLKGLDVEEAVLTGALLALLVWTRDAFTGRPDPRSRQHTVAVFFGSWAVATAVGLAVVLADPDAKVGSPGLRKLLQHVLLGLVGVVGPVRFHSSERGDEVSVALALLGGVVLALTVASLLRPAGGPRPLDAADESAARDLLARPGHQDSLGYFSLRRDKSVLFSPSGKAAVTYRVIGGVSLAAGDPLGDPEAWPGAIDAWLGEARRYAWVPAVLGASEQAADAYHRSGLDALELGDEAIVHVEEFTLEGRAMRTVRQAVNRACRQGITVEVSMAGELRADELSEIVHAADDWRGTATERGFAMALGRLGDPTDHDCRVVRGRDAHGKLVGLLHLVPWGRDGLSLDLMRRDPAADNGVVELLIAELVADCKRTGVTRISLNFAVFRAVLERGGRLGAGPVLRLWRRTLLGASHFWQIESLYRANAKYRPTWEPRFLCFPTARDLARITVAALEAEAFIVLPRVLRRRPRWD
jgi:lysyl-tRNA synthetase class 2